MTDLAALMGLDAARPQPLPPRDGQPWEALLEPGERLLWQGRPDPGFHLNWRHAVLAALGAAVLALSVALAVQAAGGLRDGVEGAGGALAAAAAGAALGLGCMIGPGLNDMLRRRGTAYALTDRRALVETDYMGTGLVAWPITADSPVWRGGGRPAGAFFALYRSPDPHVLLRPSRRAARLHPVGFERIAEADKVLALLESIREGRA